MMQIHSNTRSKMGRDWEKVKAFYDETYIRKNMIDAFIEKVRKENMRINEITREVSKMVLNKAEKDYFTTNF